jgi:hypothetical protein
MIKVVPVRREHTINGVIATDRVHNTPWAFLPPALFPPLPLSFIAWSSKLAVAASLGFMLLLLVLMLGGFVGLTE